ncbi:MAG: class I SAM-dependent methyltransferase [Lachnospiraceae bacterium]|nr:class I SAM-dependent methyltransferase [Lachnospiraceae bacterium]
MELCKLPRRLEAIIGMLDPGCELADVGCDHGYTGITAVLRGIAKKALLTDIRPGPLNAAKENARRADPEGERILTRLSDGLAKIEVKEADTLIISGMGGPLIQSILTKEPEKTASFRTMILSPQSLIPEFRRFLKEGGFSVLDEAFVFEDGKYYTVIKTAPVDVMSTPERLPALEKAEDETDIMSTDRIPGELACEFGAILLERKDPVLKQFLYERLEKCDIILCKLEAGTPSESAKKAAGLQGKQREMILSALEYYK